MGVLYKPLSKTSVDAGWLRTNKQATFADTNFFQEDQFYVGVEQELTRQLSARSDVAITSHEYGVTATAGPGIFTGEREDDLITVDVRLLYRLTEWVRADVRYEYNRRDSNASVFDYTDHQLIVGLAIEL